MSETAKFDPSKPYSEVHAHPKGWRYLQDGVYFNIHGQPVGKPPGKPHISTIQRVKRIQDQAQKAQALVGGQATARPIPLPGGTPGQDDVRKENARARAAEELNEDA